MNNCLEFVNRVCIRDRTVKDNDTSDCSTAKLTVLNVKRKLGNIDLFNASKKLKRFEKTIILLLYLIGKILNLNGKSINVLPRVKKLNVIIGNELFSANRTYAVFIRMVAGCGNTRYLRSSAYTVCCALTRLSAGRLLGNRSVLEDMCGYVGLLTANALMPVFSLTLRPIG